MPFYPLTYEYRESSSKLVFYGIDESGEDVCRSFFATCEAVVVWNGAVPSSLPEGVLPAGSVRFKPYHFPATHELLGTRYTVHASAWGRFRGLLLRQPMEPRLFGSVPPNSVGRFWLAEHKLKLAHWWEDGSETPRLADPQPPPPVLRVAVFDIETSMATGEILAFHLSLAHLTGGRRPQFPLGRWQVQRSPHPSSLFARAETERELLLRCVELFQSMRPHVIAGHNVVGFDLIRLIERLRVTGGNAPTSGSVYSTEEFFLGKGTRTPLRIEERVFQSKGKGTNRTYSITGFHGIVFDTLTHYQLNDPGTVDKKLDTIAAHFLGAQKTGLRYDQIEPFVFSTDRKENEALAVYNEMDCLLVLRLLQHNDLVNFCLGESSFFGCNAGELSARGASLRSEAVLDRLGRSLETLIETPLRREEDASADWVGYAGPKALLDQLRERRPELRWGIRRTGDGHADAVLVGPPGEAHGARSLKDGSRFVKAVGGICYPPSRAEASACGKSRWAIRYGDTDSAMAYLIEHGDDSPVVVFDFASLYPSCMLAADIGADNTAFLKDINPGMEFTLHCQWYIHIRSRNQTVPPIPADVAVKVIGSDDTHIYYEEIPNARTLVSTPGLAILARAAREALTRRKQVRKLLKTETDQAERSRLDILQLCHKVTGNSLYGVTLSRGGLRAEALGQLITATARKSIIRAIQHICQPDFPVPDRLTPRGVAAYCNWLAGDYADRVFGHGAIEFEFETIYYRFTALSAKNYAAIDFGEDGRLAFEKGTRAPTTELNPAWWLEGEPGVLRVFAESDEVRAMFLPERVAFATEGPGPWDFAVDPPAAVAAASAVVRTRGGDALACTPFAANGPYVDLQDIMEAVAVACSAPWALRRAVKPKLKSQKRSTMRAVAHAQLALIGARLFRRDLRAEVRRIRDTIKAGILPPSHFVARSKVGKRREEYASGTRIRDLIEQQTGEDDETELYGETIVYYPVAMDEDASLEAELRRAEGPRPPCVDYPLVKGITTAIGNIASDEAERLLLLGELYRRAPLADAVRALASTVDVLSFFGISRERLDHAQERLVNPESQTWFAEARARLTGPGPWTRPQVRAAFGTADGLPEDTGAPMRAVAANLRPASVDWSTASIQARVAAYEATCRDCMVRTHGAVADIEELVNTCSNRQCTTWMDRRHAWDAADELVAME